MSSASRWSVVAHASVLGVSAVVSACGPPPSVATPSPSPAQTATSATPPSGPPAEAKAPPDPTGEPDGPVAPPPPPVADKDEPLAAKFGLALPLGHYTFPDGLRVRFVATHECEYDSTAPCSPFDVIAWFKGKEGKVNLLPGKSARLVGHSVQVTDDQSLVVRK